MTKKIIFIIVLLVISGCQSEVVIPPPTNEASNTLTNEISDTSVNEAYEQIEENDTDFVGVTGSVINENKDLFDFYSWTDISLGLPKNFKVLDFESYENTLYATIANEGLYQYRAGAWYKIVGTADSTYGIGDLHIFNNSFYTVINNDAYKLNSQKDFWICLSCKRSDPDIGLHEFFNDTIVFIEQDDDNARPEFLKAKMDEEFITEKLEFPFGGFGTQINTDIKLYQNEVWYKSQKNGIYHFNSEIWEKLNDESGEICINKGVLYLITEEKIQSYSGNWKNVKDSGDYYCSSFKDGALFYMSYKDPFIINKGKEFNLINRDADVDFDIVEPEAIDILKVHSIENTVFMFRSFNSRMINNIDYDYQTENLNSKILALTIDE